MKHKILILLIFVVCLAIPNSLLSKGSRQAPEQDLTQNLERWKNLSPEQKDVLRQRLQEFKQLPEERRRQLIENYQHFKTLSPEERDGIRRKYEEWRNLPPDEKQRIKRNYEIWNRMDPNERNKYIARHKNRHLGPAGPQQKGINKPKVRQ